MVKAAKHAEQLSDARLGELAAFAFRRGLDDGRTTSNPKPAAEVWRLLMTGCAAPADRRIIHTKKLRQVYGAGFDISRNLTRHPTRNPEG